MKASNCEQSDGYVGRWLAEDERLGFEAHLVNCPECRQVVQEQQRLDGLLARAHATLLPVRADLMDQIDHRLRRARRRRVTAWVGGLAAASVLACALAVWFLAQRTPQNGPVRSLMVMAPEQLSQPARDPRSLVEVTFQPTSEVIAVSRQTENRSVTIIWLYPTIKAAPESASTPADLFEPPERNGI